MQGDIKMSKLASCGGCGAKVGAGMLSQILQGIPTVRDENLLVGYDTSDDAAVYKVSDDLAIVQTLDFFPPIVDDPFMFGQIAAANALSDVYAMGGEVKTALNLVCFPESMDLNVLGEILRGGAEKVAEAGGTLAGGHSIADTGVKIDINDDGRVFILSPDQEASAAAKKMIDNIVKDIEVGEVFLGKVVNILPIGAQVELKPGKKGLVHISKLANRRVEKVEDVVSLGDEILVRVIDIKPDGKIDLTRKGLLPEDKQN